MTDTMEESRALNLAITPTLSRRRESGRGTAR
jgi:hypothetical protein